MTDHAPLYLGKLQAIRRGIEEGWYAVDSEGIFYFGPFATREACVDSLTPPAR